MRKLKLFFACLLMAVLSIGQVWGASPATLSFTEKCNGSGTDSDGNSWTITSDGNESNFDSDKGIHYGTNNANVQYVQLSTSGISGTITQVVVNAYDAQPKATASVTVGGTAYTCSGSASVTNTSANFTFTGSSTGEIVVKVDRGSSMKKAIYVKSVVVTYTTGSTVAVTSVTLDESAITLDEEATQTLTATVLPENATNKNVTWESNNEDVATVVNGVVTAKGAGDATIKCKSVADATKYAECAVHVNPSIYSKSNLIFAAACGGSGTADDDAEWAVTSDGNESNFDNVRGIHYGTGSASVQYVQLTTSDISGTIAKVVVNASDATGTAEISVSVGGTDFTCSGSTTVTNSNPGVDYTFTGSASGEIVVRIDRGSAAVKAIYVKSVVVTYVSDGKEAADLAYAEEDKKNLVKLGDAFTAPTLTNPHGLTVAYESSNTDVAEVASNGALTIKAVGVAEITASSEETDTYKAGSAQYALYVVAHEGTEADPYTVADARVVIDNVGETGIADKYATGIVSKIVTAFNPTYGNITYDISSDGTTESAQLRAYRGFDKDGAWFTSEDDVLVGDEVVVKGSLKKHNTTYEFDEGNQLVSLNRNKEAAGLAYTVTAIEKNIDAEVFINPLTNPNGLTVTYSSSDENLAVVNEYTGEVLVGSEDGTVTITASTNGDATHLAGTATYTITISDPSLTKVTFDATIDIATDNAEGVTKSGINIITTHTDGENDQHNPITYYQTFKNQTLTVTSTVGNIKKIDFVTTGASYSANGFEGVANEKWSGDASEIVLTASGNQVRMSKIIVSYIPDTRAEAGLAYAETAIEKEVGDDAFVNALTNPNSVAVTYESSDTDVAEVASNGTVTIKAQGIATITASFEGNATYKPASVSYELTVNEPGMDNVTFNSADDQAASGETTITKGGFTFTFSAGSMDGTYSEYRLHKSQTMTLSSTAYYIKKIEFTCTSGNPISGFADAEGLDKDNNQWTGQANSVELTASNAQVRIEKLKVYYIEDTRAASGLAWNPADDIELTVGDAFSAPALLNPNSIDAAEITIESSNTSLATVTNGEVALVADATGTTTITATFAGNDDYKPATVSYKITVNPAYSIYVQPSLNVNFGSVNQNAEVADKSITVTLTGVDAATLTLEGTGASAFTISPAAALTASGDITISASSANIGTFAATLTISDDASQAESKVVHLSLTVNEVVVPETPVSTESKWVVATAADLVDGAEVLITGVKDDVTYAMGGQNKNNRAAVAASVDGEDVLTPGENTMSFTLVAQETEGVFALRTSNGKYLYAAASGDNHMKTQNEVDVNAKWTISATSAVAESSSNRNVMQFNGGSSLFSCYNTASQTAIQFYVPKPVTPPTPTSEDVRTGLELNRYYTICLEKEVTAATGATFWNLKNRNSAETEVYLESVQLPLEAGKPYIFQATATTLNVTYGDETQATPVENGALRGTFDNLNATELAAKATHVYILIQNSIAPVGTANSLKANRAYIDYDALNVGQPQSAPGKHVRAIPMQPKVATGFDAINASDAPAKLIIDGQIYILRGEKMYDATGRLVK